MKLAIDSDKDEEREHAGSPKQDGVPCNRTLWSESGSKERKSDNAKKYSPVLKQCYQRSVATLHAVELRQLTRHDRRNRRSEMYQRQEAKTGPLQHVSQSPSQKAA